MVAPSSGAYTRWAAWLDAFAKGEAPPMDDLPAMDPAWGAAMSNRLLDRLADAFGARLTRWNEELNRDLSTTGLTHERLGATLVAARRRLVPLRRLAASNLLDDDVRDAMGSALEQSVSSAQDNLLASADRTRDGGQVRDVVRRHSLVHGLEADVAPGGDAGDNGPGRQIILD